MVTSQIETSCVLEINDHSVDRLVQDLQTLEAGKCQQVVNTICAATWPVDAKPWLQEQPEITHASLCSQFNREIVKRGSEIRLGQPLIPPIQMLISYLDWGRLGEEILNHHHDLLGSFLAQMFTSNPLYASHENVYGHSLNPQLHKIWDDLRGFCDQDVTAMILRGGFSVDERFLSRNFQREI